MPDHRFVPTVYNTTLGPHDPVLTIESGDRVFTTIAGVVLLFSTACHQE